MVLLKGWAHALFYLSLLPDIMPSATCSQVDNAHLYEPLADYHGGMNTLERGHPNANKHWGQSSISTPSQHNRTWLGARSEVDVVAAIDDFADQWLQARLEYASDSAALSVLLNITKRVKYGILNPVESHVVSSSTLTTSSVPSSQHTGWSHLNSTSSSSHFPLANSSSTSVSNSTLEAARILVHLAQQEANERNAERIKNPRVNHYYGRENSPAARKKRAEDAQLFTVNATVAAAAAAVAEADAVASPLPLKDYSQIIASVSGRQRQKRQDPLQKRATSFWMEDMDHTGKIPYGSDNADLQGTYLISSPIVAYYHTQMVGNYNIMPILVAAKSFVGLGLISSDVYTGGDGGNEEWYINQSNFLRQIRNFIIDVSGADVVDAAGIHWQVAQATSIQQVFFVQSTESAKSQMGIFAENGSGGFMSDLFFVGGAIGIRCGSQQFTTRNLVFDGCSTAIDMLWDWGWTWKSLDIENADYGIKMTGDYQGGSLLVLDSSMSNVGTGIYVTTPQGTTVEAEFSVNIDNLVLSSVPTAVDHVAAGVTLAGGSLTIDSWTLGKIYDTENPNGTFQAGGSLSSTSAKTGMLMGDNGFFERSKPQYEDLTANDFLNANLAASGDAVTDDTYGLSLMLLLAGLLDRPLFIPMGSYLITDTLTISTGSRVVGENWSQLVAKGPNFEDVSNPRVMIKVGNEGDSGIVEIQDLMFTNEGPTAGLIAMEWNVAGSTQGSAAMWDSHFRIGGAAGSHLQAGDCPKLTGSVNPDCIAGSLMLHLTADSSAYLENVWAWVADHDLDSGLDQTQIDVYVARGILIESNGPTWMYGTASEHSVLYQYQLSDAHNVYMGMIQTESPYYLPTPQAPAPFADTVGVFARDPTFADCNTTASPHCAAAWGFRAVGSSEVYIMGAGLYSWFQDYDQNCVDTQDCQQRVLEIIGSDSVWLYNLYTVGIVEMVNTQSGDPILSKPNTNEQQHPFTSVINAWLIASTNSYNPDDYTAVSRPSCTASYKTMDDIVKYAANIPANCLDTYIVAAQVSNLTDSLQKYSTTIAEGYDGKFDIYAEHITELVPQQLKEYMAGAQASGFFTCTTTGRVVCCSDCQSAWGCPVDCDRSKPCTSGIRTTTIDCPTTIRDPTDQTSAIPIDYTCTDQNGFFAAIGDQYGIDRNWVVFGKYLARINGGCWGNSNPDCGAKTNTYYTGFPLAGNVTVLNPKDLIAATLDSTRDLGGNLADTSYWMESSLDEARMSDLVDAGSVPTFLLYSAVANMDRVVAVADQITADERREQIFLFISAVLMLIPGVGEVADAAGLAALRSMINLLGDLASAALGIYDVVQDPKNAIFAIFGAFLGAGGSSKSFVDAAGGRRRLSGKDEDGLAPIKPDLDKITTLRSSCFRQ